MPRILFTLSVIAALCVSHPTIAQETETDDATEAAEQTDTQAAGEGEATEEQSGLQSQLDMGQPVQEDPTYVKETYGDWELKCFRTDAGEDPCQMYQLLREDSGNAIAELSLFRLPDGDAAVAGATLIVPLGTLLTEDLTISVDGGVAKSYSYRFCNLVGCYAQIGLTQEDIDSYQRGLSVAIKIVPAQAPDQTVEIKASLSGFTAAYENTSVLAQ